MANPTRKTTTVIEDTTMPTVDGDGVTVLEATPDIDADQELDALEGMISEFCGSSDAVVNVYRQGKGKNLAFLFRTSPDEMSGGELMEKVRDNYGTGTYRVHIRKGTRIVHNRPFEVETRGPDPAATYTPGQHDNALGTAELLAIMQQQADRTMQMFTQTMQSFSEALKGRDAPAFNPAEMQSTLIQSLAALKQMTEPTESTGDAVKMLIQGLTLAKDLQPKEGETNTSDILLKALDTFGPTIAAASGRALPPALGGPTPGAPGASGAAAAAADPQVAKDAEAERQKGMQSAAMRQQLAWLIKQAAAGKNPDLYAELLLDQVGEAVVLDFIGKPDAMDKLIALDGNVSLYRPWFDSLKNCIHDLTRPEVKGDTGQQGVFVSGAQPHAVQYPAESGHATGDSVGPRGDTPDT